MSRNSRFKEISVWTVYDLMSCSCNPKRVVDVMLISTRLVILHKVSVFDRALEQAIVAPADTRSH